MSMGTRLGTVITSRMREQGSELHHGGNNLDTDRAPQNSSGKKLETPKRMRNVVVRFSQALPE